MTVSEIQKRLGIYNISKASLYRIIHSQRLCDRKLNKYDIDDQTVFVIIQSWNGRYHPPGFMLISDIADMLEISRKTLYRYIKQNIIKAQKVNGIYYISQQELSKFRKEVV